MDTMPHALETLKALGERGFAPDGGLVLNFVPERHDAKMVRNAITMMDARHELVEMALGFQNTLRLIADHGLAFSITLDVFSIPAIEACLYQAKEKRQRQKAMALL